MGNEHRFGALQVRVAGHRRFARGLGHGDERLGPTLEPGDGLRNLRAHVEAQVRRDLLVAAAARVQLAAERAKPRGQLDLDVVMNVLGLGVLAHGGLARLRRIVGGDGVERRAELRQLIGGKNSGSTKGRCVCLAGSHFLGKQLPVEDDGALPQLELAIERLAEAP